MLPGTSPGRSCPRARCSGTGSATGGRRSAPPAIPAPLHRSACRASPAVTRPFSGPAYPHLYPHVPIAVHKTALDVSGAFYLVFQSVTGLHRTSVEVPGRGTGAGDRNRTYDLRITNAPLYQLSYSGSEGPLRLEDRKRRGILREAARRRQRVLHGAAGRRNAPQRAGRRRITRSRPATSMPGGGAGRRLNCTSGSATSVSAPEASS